MLKFIRNFFADQHNQRGLKFMPDGSVPDYHKATDAFRKAIDWDPAWSVPWYNLGLLNKFKRNWPESLRCNKRAYELCPMDDAAIWNWGIAATALMDWREARRAWERYGIPLPDGEGELDMKMGAVPIRIDPDGCAEVVWCSRIDPARAVVNNVPEAESNRRFGDLLLTDGAPNGSRKVNGHVIPVFNEIQVLKSSDYSSFAAVVRATSDEALDGLMQCAEARKLGIETEHSVQKICHQCSIGEAHEHGPRVPLDFSQPILVRAAAPNEFELDLLFQSWSTENFGCGVESIECVLK